MTLLNLFKQTEYILFLKSEIEQLRKEKQELQDTLFRTLKLHLIPNNREELKEISQPIPITPTRNIRTHLSQLQKDSWGKSIKDKIQEVENELDHNEKV